VRQDSGRDQVAGHYFMTEARWPPLPNASWASPPLSSAMTRSMPVSDSSRASNPSSPSSSDESFDFSASRPPSTAEPSLEWSRFPLPDPRKVRTKAPLSSSNSNHQRGPALANA